MTETRQAPRLFVSTRTFSIVFLSSLRVVRLPYCYTLSTRILFAHCRGQLLGGSSNWSLKIKAWPPHKSENRRSYLRFDTEIVLHRLTSRAGKSPLNTFIFVPHSPHTFRNVRVSTVQRSISTVFVCSNL